MRYRVMTVDEMKNIEFIHHGHDRINRWMFTPVKNVNGFAKPIGGFWASKYIKDESSKFRSNWEDFFVSGFSPDIVKRFANCNLTFRLKNSANILLINSKNDIKQLAEEYEYVLDDSKENDIFRSMIRVMETIHLDWEKISCKYDGIYITERGMEEVYHTLYGWDIESICLFNLDCIDK